MFRAVKGNPPVRQDFECYWDQGGRPERRTSPAQIRTFKSVSTFDTLERARAKASALGLGRYIAELKLPDDVKRQIRATGHVDLEETTPEQLLGYVVKLHPLQEAGTL